MKQQLLRSIRLSDGAFAGRLAAKYRWSIDRYAALKEGALVYVIWNRSRRKSNEGEKKLHFTISPTYRITNIYQELGAKVKLLEHTVQQAAKRQKLLTRTVEQSIRHEQRVQHSIMSHLTGKKPSKYLIGKHLLSTASRDKAGVKKSEKDVSYRSVGTRSRNETVVEYASKVRYQTFNQFYRGINIALRDKLYAIEKGNAIRVDKPNRKGSIYSNGFSNDIKQASPGKIDLDSLLRSTDIRNKQLSPIAYRQSDIPVQLLRRQAKTDKLQKREQLLDEQKERMTTASSWQTTQRQFANKTMFHIRVSPSIIRDGRDSRYLFNSSSLNVQSPTVQSDVQPAGTNHAASKPVKPAENTIEVAREISFAALDPTMRSPLAKLLQIQPARHYSPQDQERSKVNDRQRKARSIYARLKNKELSIVQRKHLVSASSNALHKTTLFIRSDYSETLQRVRQLFAKESRTGLIRLRIGQKQEQEDGQAGQSSIIVHRNEPQLARESRQHRLIPLLRAKWFTQQSKQVKSSSFNNYMELTKNHFIFKQAHMRQQIMMEMRKDHDRQAKKAGHLNRVEYSSLIERKEKINARLSEAAQLAANRWHSEQGLQTKHTNQFEVRSSKKESEVLLIWQQLQRKLVGRQGAEAMLQVGKPSQARKMLQQQQVQQVQQKQQAKQLLQARQLLQVKQVISVTQIEKKNTQILRKEERRSSELIARVRVQGRMVQQVSQASTLLSTAPQQEVARLASMQQATQSSLHLDRDYMQGGMLVSAKAPSRRSSRLASVQHVSQSSLHPDRDYMRGGKLPTLKAPLREAARTASVQHASQAKMLPGRQPMLSVGKVPPIQQVSHKSPVQQTELQVQAATVHPKASQLSAPVSHPASAPSVETAVMQVLKRSEASATAEKQSKQAIASIEAAVKVVEKELQHMKEQSSKPQTSVKQMTELVMREITQQLRIGQLKRGL